MQKNKKFIYLLALSLIVLIIFISFIYSQLHRTGNIEIQKSEILSINDTCIDVNSTNKLDSLSELNSEITDTSECYRIMITGVDSRLAGGCPHADANHLLTIYPDRAYIDIVSIPRGTLAPAGQSDSSGQNYLANTRAVKGRDRYLLEVCRIADIDSIDYFIEFGFSQAVGLIKLLGFGSNSISTLRVLRARKSFPQGDYQRCYNQGQFIRQMILKHFEAMKSSISGVLISGAFALVESNMPKDTANMLINRLIRSGFPQNSKSVTVRLKPQYSQVKDFNFMNQKSIDSLHKLIVARAPHDSTFMTEQSIDAVSKRMIRKLSFALTNAENNSNNPKYVYSKLLPIYKQKAWFQIENTNDRRRIRNRIYTLLKKAAMEVRDKDLIHQIDNEIVSEKLIEEIKVNKPATLQTIINWYGKEFIIGKIK